MPLISRFPWLTSLTGRFRLRLGLALLVLAMATGGALLPYRGPIVWAIWHHTGLAALAGALNPGDASLMFALGEYYFNHGAYDVERARHYYERAIALNPEYLEAHYQLARIDFINGRFFQALEHIKTVIELNPDFKRAYYMHGLISGYNGNMLQAIWGFEEFIKRDSFNWAGYNDLAWVYFQLGDFEKTLETAERGLAQAYGNPWLLNMQGLALMNLDRQSEAHQSFTEAKSVTDRMSPADWGIAYPGNNPTIYAEGLERMREAIAHNLELTGVAKN